MKAYLIITGAIFGLMAALHVWRAIDERHTMTTDPGQFFGMAAIGVLSAALSVWAWRLLRRQGR
jgi:H+/Cl- antiporter ClcA